MQSPSIDPNLFTTFINLSFFTNTYQHFLNLFPAPTQWFVSVIVLISLIAAFFVLIRTHWIFIIILILLIPFLYPILQSLFGGIWDFILYLWHTITTGMPKFG